MEIDELYDLMEDLGESCKTEEIIISHERSFKCDIEEDTLGDQEEEEDDEEGGFMGCTGGELDVGCDDLRNAISEERHSE